MIGLSETWLHGKTYSLSSLPSFEIVTNNRQTRRGGVALFVWLNYDFTIHSELSCMTPVLETVFIKIGNPSKNKNNKKRNFDQCYLQTIRLKTK